MSDESLNIRRRNLPHWVLEGSLYFVTFRTAGTCLRDVEQALVMRHIHAGEERFYELPAAVVMPDHVHLLLKPRSPYELPRVMKGIKGASARKVNELRSTTGSVWQDESWDRIVRDAVEFEEKLQYLAENPVKAGLVKRAEDYPFWYCNKELL